MSKNTDKSRLNQNKSSLEKSLPFFALILIFLFIPLIVFAINTGVLTVTGNSVFEQEVRVIGTLTGSSDFRIQEGVDYLDVNGNVIYSTYTDIPTLNMVRALTIPDDFNFSYIFQRSSILSPFNISFIFWDSFLERPTLVLNGGVSGRASTFDRSLQVGKNRGSGDVNQTYDICEGTTLADCDTLLTGADLIVEDDIENFGSIQSHENLIVDGNSFITIFYGEIFQHNQGTEIVLNPTDTFFTIDGMELGLVNGFDINSTESLIAVEAGTYKASWGISISDLANRVFVAGVSVDNNVQISTLAHATTLNPNHQISMSSNGIITVDVNSSISLVIKSNILTTVDIQHASLTLVRIGS